MNAVSTTVARATADDWTRFMRPIAMAVRNIPAEDDFRSRIAAIAHAVAVPAAWLRQPWRQSEAMRKFQFWPSVSDIADLFEEDLKAERETQSRRAGLALPAPSAAEDRDPVEIAAVMAKAKAFASEMDSRRQPDGEMAPVRPMPLSDGALLVEYERMAADGNGMAAVRVKTLRARLGVEA